MALVFGSASKRATRRGARRQSKFSATQIRFPRSLARRPGSSRPRRRPWLLLFPIALVVAASLNIYGRPWKGILEDVSALAVNTTNKSGQYSKITRVTCREMNRSAVALLPARGVSFSGQKTRNYISPGSSRGWDYFFAKSLPVFPSPFLFFPFPPRLVSFRDYAGWPCASSPLSLSLLGFFASPFLSAWPINTRGFHCTCREPRHRLWPPSPRVAADPLAVLPR